jgi:hypothetical protein
VRLAAALLLTLGLLGLTATEASAAVPSPWIKDDPAGDASRPQGDLRRVIVENGRTQVRFTFRMAASPAWDTAATSRHTFMRFLLDWQGSSTAYNRKVTASWAGGTWNVNVYNSLGNSICTSTGGVTNLGNHRWRFSVPTGGTFACLGGARVLRVAAAFTDDRDDSAGEDLRLDKVPDGGGYGAFIQLPA